MKQIILTTALFISILGTSAQNVLISDKCEEVNSSKYCISSKDGEVVLTKDGKVVPGAITVKPEPATVPPKKVYKKYCVQNKGMYNRAVVADNGEVVNNYVYLQSGAKLTAEGKVIWTDNSSTILKNGACVDDMGTISAPPTVTSRVDKPVIHEQLSSSFEFKAFIEKVKEEFASNESNINSAKTKSESAINAAGKKESKMADALIKENNELKLDLQNFITNGAGDWKDFKKEFMQDLAMLKQDIYNLQFEAEELSATDIK